MLVIENEVATMTDEERELKELQDRIDAANARRDETLEATSKASLIARKKLELAAAEQAAKNAAVLEKWTKEKGPRGGEWDALEFKSGVAIFIPPPRPVFDKWSPNAASSDSTHLLEIVTPCVKFPSMVEFDKMLNAEPMKLISASAICARLGGAKVKDVEGK